MQEIDRCLLRAKKCIGYEAALGFISTFICGFLIHLMVFVNYLPTHSGLVAFVENGAGFAREGRWFSTFLKNIAGVVTIPFFLGMISLFFWSMSFAVIVKIFKIRSRAAIILASAIYISFPTVAAMNLFMYMAHCFAAGTFLACLGVYLITRGRKAANVGGIICLVLAVATYQAVLSMAMVLFFVIVAFELIEGERIKDLWLKIGKYSISLVISLGVYYITFKSYLLISGVESYRDFTVTAESFFRGIIKCYGGAYWFLGWGSVFSRPVGKIIACLTIALIVITVAGLLGYKWKGYNNKSARVLMLIGLVILCPIVTNYTFLVSPDEARTYRQFSSYAIIFCMPILVCERYEEELSGILSKLKIRNGGLLLQQFIALIAVVSVLYYGIVDNIAYVNTHMQYEREYSLVVRVVDRIENTEGYERGMPVIIMFCEEYYDGLYGGTLEAQLDKYIPGMEQCGWGYLGTPTGFQYFIDEFIQADINLTWEPIDGEMLEEMNKWPENGCTLVRDGKLYLWLT